MNTDQNTNQNMNGGSSDPAGNSGQIVDPPLQAQPAPAPQAQPQAATPAPAPQAQPQPATPAPAPQAQPQAATPPPAPQAQPQVAAPAPAPQAQPQAATPAPASTPTPAPGLQITVDGAKSAEQYIKECEANYIVPALVREKYPDLIKLIYETESMNKEEREYWLQILPIMSEEQIVKFRDILVNEKEQLAKLDQEYETEMSKINRQPVKQISEAEMKAKMEHIAQAEEKHEETEQAEEAKLLEQLEGIS